MPDPFDASRYLTHLRARWRLPAIIAGGALATSLTVSLLMAKKYTAKVMLVIEPPAGNDNRVSTAVSPIYLESLKTYEHFASSDQLFAQTVDRFQLRAAGALGARRSIEGLKRDVLKVSIPRNTKILEIATTLPDPQKAHALALYIAEETIKLNRKANRAGDDELITETRKRVEEAGRRLAAVEAARNRAAQRSPTPEALRAELEQLRAIREEVDRLALSAELSAAEQRSGKARAERLHQQAADLDRRTAAKQEMLARRSTEAESLAAQYESAWTAREEMEKRLREVEATAGYRGERLNLLDPGIVPERASSPNLPLNLVVAVSLGLIASLLYLTLEFSLQAQRGETVHKTFRIAAKP